MRQEIRFIWLCSTNCELYDVDITMHKQLLSMFFDQHNDPNLGQVKIEVKPLANSDEIWYYLGQL